MVTATGGHPGSHIYQGIDQGFPDPIGAAGNNDHFILKIRRHANSLLAANLA
jgi:hypothetical protein